MSSERMTICNMIVEMGATTGPVPVRRADPRLAGQPAARQDDCSELAADEGATYDEHEIIELASWSR